MQVRSKQVNYPMSRFFMGKESMKEESKVKPVHIAWILNDTPRNLTGLILSDKESARDLYHARGWDRAVDG